MKIDIAESGGSKLQICQEFIHVGIEFEYS